MEIIIKTYAEMSKYAADLIAETIRKPDCVLGLATGSTYRHLSGIDKTA